MIWTILKADLLWWLITIPLVVGLQLVQALKAKRAQQAALLRSPAWARRALGPEEKFKIATMRRRRGRR